MSLFSIIVDIAASTARLEAGLHDATAKIETFGNRVKSIATTVGAAFSVVKLVEFTERIIAMGAELEHASQRAGVSGKTFSELAYAAKQSGVGTDSLAAAMTKMNRAMSLASTGGKEQTQALAALGLSWNQLKNLRPEEQLEVIAQAFSKLKSPADQARAGSILFGRGWAEIAPLLLQGADGIIKLRTEANNLHAAFSDDMLKKLEEAHKSIEKMESAASAAATTLVAKLAPAITGLANSMTAAISGDKTEKLKNDIDFLRRMGKEEGYFNFGGDNNLGGFGYHSASAANQLADQLQAQLDRQKLVLSPDTMPSIDMSNVIKGLDLKPPPGFANLPELSEIRTGAMKVQNDKLKQLYDEMNDNTKTATEHEVSRFEWMNAQLDELVKARLLSQEEANKRIAASLDELLPGIQLSSKKMIAGVKEPFDELDKIGEATAQKLQDDFAKFLFDPLHFGFKEMAKDFLITLQKMSADAAAAGIFKQLFGEGDGTKGGGSGLGNTFAKGLHSIFGGGTTQGGGDASVYGKYMKQMLSSGPDISNYFGGGSAGSVGLDAGQTADLDSYLTNMSMQTAGGVAADAGQIASTSSNALTGIMDSFGGFMAEGGLVSAGSSYLVGEEGPELFTAAQHGQITPNSDLQGMGGGGVGDVHIHNNIDARGADAERIMTMLPPLLAAHGTRMKSDILHSFRRTGLPAPNKA